MDAASMRYACLEIQTMIYMITDEVGKDKQYLDYVKCCGSVMLPLCGRWPGGLSCETVRIIAEFLLPNKPPVWHRYPDLDVLPHAPVMPYEYGHHLRLEFLFPGYAIPNPDVWHEAGEDIWRVEVTLLSLKHQRRWVSKTRGEVRRELQGWERIIAWMKAVLQRS